MPSVHYHVLLASLALFSAAAQARAAWQPYVIGAGGEYAVIDSSKSVVVSSGNIFSELLGDATFYSKHAFLEKSHDIGTTYLDPVHDRFFIFTGDRPGQGDDGSTDGLLVLRLSDRKYINYLSIPYGSFGNDEMFVSADNQIYIPGGNGTMVYDGKTYKKTHPDITFDYSASKTCFIPGERKVSDAVWGIYYLDKYIKSDFSHKKLNVVEESQLEKLAQKVAYQLDCANGKSLLVERVANPNENNSPKLIVYDLKSDKEIFRFSSEYSDALGEWRLSRDGSYAVWNGEIMVSGPNGNERMQQSGHIAVYRMSNGEKVCDVKLPEKTKNELADYKDYNFKDFSADGKAVTLYSDGYLYVVSIPDGALLKKIGVPFVPGWYNSTGFVVWP